MPRRAGAQAGGMGMGMYVSVRRWLEAGRRQREAVEAVIAAARRDSYSGGWAFPERPFNWSLYVFYGGDIREAELPWLRGQVESMAALPPVDDDGDMPVGLFVLCDERAAASSGKCATGWSVTGLLPSWNRYSVSEHQCPTPSLLSCVSEQVNCAGKDKV
jgi:hypothetical protein